MTGPKAIYVSQLTCLPVFGLPEEALRRLVKEKELLSLEFADLILVRAEDVEEALEQLTEEAGEIAP